ncbi:hypothetical protein DL546_002274 [Coniochaeta pulveracea]|uniref:Uncharacterized protein n=1 Tax=Coniochaeta pulveracea TaxID=177199 RepID=A0A420YBB2_9PEZI|nr:hypothetical protein DL546_002274 [Coniochaeta pulveracea]
MLKRAGLMPSPPGTTDAERAAAAARDESNDYLTPHELAVVERFNLPREQVGTPLFEIAEVMYRQKCEYWGFITFQTYGYGSGLEKARWDEFWKRWGKMMNNRLGRLVMDGIKNAGVGGEEEARFAQMYEVAMASGILPLWHLKVIEHEGMDGMSPHEVRLMFREILKGDEEEVGDDSKPNRVPVGVDAGLCLMVDEGVVNSLLDEREGKRPYIIGVLSDIDDDEVPDEVEAVHFKIALESVVDLWRQISVQHVNVLIPPEGKIYISPGVFDDDDD